MLPLWTRRERNVVRREVTVRSRTPAPARAEGDIKPLLVRIERLAPEMPFAGEEGRVTGLLEHLRDGRFFQFELLLVRRREQPVLILGQRAGFVGLWAADIVGDADA